MAYVKQGFTDERLVTLYYEAVREGKDDPYLRARFGTPLSASTQKKHGLSNVRQGDEAVPYRFLGASPMRSYNQLGRPHYVDSSGRQYYGLGARQPRMCYCRIPKGLTAKENKAGVVGVFRTDFPRPGEELTLWPSTAFDRVTRDKVPVLNVTVQSIAMQTIAVALIQVSETLVLPDGIDVDKDVDGDDLEGALKRRADHAQQLLEEAEERAREIEKKLRAENYAFPDSVTSIPKTTHSKQSTVSTGTRVRSAKAPQAKFAHGKRARVSK